jgi:transcriptional regulator with XRE-family HTH domain
MIVPGDPGPLVRRRQLASTLRQYRLDAGMSIRDVAEHLLCSVAKISRLETAQRGASLRDVRDLCDLYGVEDETSRERLMTLARESRETAWWQALDIDAAQKKVVGLEAAASKISDYQLGAVTGLLQTRNYARAVLSAFAQDPATLDQAVDVRMRRQEAVGRHVLLHVLLDEAAVRRPVGGSVVLNEQLEYLIQLSRDKEAWVKVQVIPFTAGVHQGLISGFTVMQFPESTRDDIEQPMPDVVYLEGLTDGIYLEQPDEVKRYLEAFGQLQSRALSITQTARFLESVRQEL